MLPEQLAGLATLSPPQLRAEWRRVHRAPPPQVTTDLLIRGIAYTLQEKALGGLSRSARSELARIGTRTTEAPRPRDVTIKPGTALVRSWNGVTHNVLVEADGYRFDGASYRSLSAIAEIITGTHWSGPRFFGLRRQGRAKGLCDAR